MKLLIITQKVDKNDPVLGFFHTWIAKLSSKFDAISVICLEKGEYDLPTNVSVYSLGKKLQAPSSKLIARVLYVWNFYKYIWRLRKEYDFVFVHMNQEYVILGWKLWKLWGKKIYFWRNHPEGNFFTRVAVWVSDKVFCTSTQSFTAKYKKTEIMPVGIDVDKFIKLESSKVHKVKNSILFLGRMDRIKRPDLLIEALNILNKKGVDFVCDFYGDPTKGGEEFYASLKAKTVEHGLQEKVHFYPGVPNNQTPAIYAKHEIFVNLTPTGSMDKTIIEASSCGCLPVVANSSLRGSIDELFIVETVDALNVAKAIQNIMGLEESEKEIKRQKLLEFAKSQDLEILIEKLASAIRNV